jgi:hypothetical protein
MVSVRQHGGGCCGARHLAGFTATEDRNPDQIVRALAEADGDRLVEVILNGTQVQNFPAAVQKLADLGFVLVGRYVNGNHNSNNYVFHRADNRLPLTDLPFNWPGMVITPETQGALTKHHQLRQFAAPATPPRPGRPYQHNYLLVGDEVQVLSPSSRHDQERAIVLSIRGHDDWGNVRYLARLQPVAPAVGEPYELSVGSLRVTRQVQDPAPPVPPPPPQLPVQRHVQPDLNRIDGPAPLPVPTVLFSTYHNVLRAGRSEGGWPSYEQARGAAPRAASVDRKEYLTDGTDRWVVGVRE